MLWILSIGGCLRSVPRKDIGYIGALPSTVTSVKVWILYLLTHPDCNLCWKSSSLIDNVLDAKLSHMYMMSCLPTIAIASNGRPQEDKMAHDF